MSDNDDPPNGHSTNGQYAEIEEVESLHRLLRLLSADIDRLRHSMDHRFEQMARNDDSILDLLRDNNKRLCELQSNRDGWDVLKRLAAVETAVAEKPKARRAGKK